MVSDEPEAADAEEPSCGCRPMAPGDRQGSVLGDGTYVPAEERQGWAALLAAEGLAPIRTRDERERQARFRAARLLAEDVALV